MVSLRSPWPVKLSEHVTGEPPASDWITPKWPKCSDWFNHTSSTAQGGGGSFKNRKPIERLVVVNQGWQSESTDGPKGA